MSTGSGINSEIGLSLEVDQKLRMTSVFLNNCLWYTVGRSLYLWCNELGKFVDKTWESISNECAAESFSRIAMDLSRPNLHHEFAAESAESFPHPRGESNRRLRNSMTPFRDDKTADHCLLPSEGIKKHKIALKYSPALKDSGDFWVPGSASKVLAAASWYHLAPKFVWQFVVWCNKTSSNYDKFSGHDVELWWFPGKRWQCTKPFNIVGARKKRQVRVGCNNTSLAQLVLLFVTGVAAVPFFFYILLHRCYSSSEDPSCPTDTSDNAKLRPRKKNSMPAIFSNTHVNRFQFVLLDCFF